MLSIGRLDGSKNFMYFATSQSEIKKCEGAKHSYVVGNAKRSSSTNSSCKYVVPLRQWPMMKIGGCSSDVRSTRRPRNSMLHKPQRRVEQRDQS